ncbi:hypothetical protein GGR56DRAFT_629841 [Xylariaceae sp. FL0804]|nr:hypothetical protein GGR56DRAFT_629841 [Xylariaceae sp. FL0804]
MASKRNPSPPASAPPGHKTTKRVPTDSSYYDFDGVPWNRKDPQSATWMYARDARAQQATCPPEPSWNYPRHFANHDNLLLSTPGAPEQGASSGAGQQSVKNSWLHHPLIPGAKTAYQGGRPNAPPGTVRSVYTQGDTNNFDVIYHDRRAGVTGQGHGKFKVSKYHPRHQG